MEEGWGNFKSLGTVWVRRLPRAFAPLLASRPNASACFHTESERAAASLCLTLFLLIDLILSTPDASQ
jgi:hypothetical protein